MAGVRPCRAGSAEVTCFALRSHYETFEEDDGVLRDTATAAPRVEGREVSSDQHDRRRGHRGTPQHGALSGSSTSANRTPGNGRTDYPLGGRWWAPVGATTDEIGAADRAPGETRRRFATRLPGEESM
jgi:hypothetical protein